jgi:hypothetical protein
MKKREPVTIIEVVITSNNNFEVKVGNVDSAAIPVLVGLLEKVKFELLIREYDDIEPEEKLPINFMNNKFDA